MRLLVELVEDDVEALHATAQREVLHVVGVFELELLLLDSIHQAFSL